MSQGREVAGLWCSDVLVDLSAYVDGELPAERVAAVEAHLRGCDWCERFGGAFGAVIARLRSHLATPEPLDAAESERLHAALDALLDG